MNTLNDAVRIAESYCADVPDQVDVTLDRNSFAAGYLAAAGGIKQTLARLRDENDSAGVIANNGAPERVWIGHPKNVADHHYWTEKHYHETQIEYVRADEHAKVVEVAMKTLTMMNQYKERHLVPAYFMNALADLRDILFKP